MNLNHLRCNIKNIRKTKGITQREMASKLFMDERSYSKIERGEKKSIDIVLLASIADILGTDICVLIEDPEEVSIVHDEFNSFHNESNRQATLAISDISLELSLLREEVKELIACQKEALEAIRSVTS